MAKLTYQKRKRMRDSSFALEKERKYPIDTIARGRNALARVAQHGTRAEQKEVKREVYAKYPSLRPNNPGVTRGNLKTVSEMDTTPEISKLYPELAELRVKRGTAIDRMGDIQEKGGSGARYQAIRDKADADLVTLQKRIAKEHPELAYRAIPKAKVSKPKIADIIMGEVILYGGLPMTRANVHRQALKDTGSAKAADMFAFGSHIKLAPEGTKSLSLAQFRKVTKPSSTRSVRITPKRPRIGG